MSRNAFAHVVRGALLDATSQPFFLLNSSSKSMNASEEGDSDFFVFRTSPICRTKALSSIGRDRRLEIADKWLDLMTKDPSKDIPNPARTRPIAEDVYVT